MKGLETAQRTVSQTVNAKTRPDCLIGNHAARGFPEFIHYLPSTHSWKAGRTQYQGNET